ncbi:MAG: VWA domain-containing protein [Proteobacteria bacterium]|nr:VWA domain-containing protein [Pseudomonadota bacterium]
MNAGAEAWLAPFLRFAEIDAFEHPERLLALAAALAVALTVLAFRRPPAVAWPALVEARVAGARRLDPGRALQWLTRAVGLAALAGVVAGPVRHSPAAPEPGLGLDIVLVLDTSASMRALDTQSAGRLQSRLDLAVEAVTRFARKRVADGDRVGLVVFGDHAFTQCPLTSDGSLLAAALGRVEAGMAGRATALGDALALGVKRATAAATAEGVEAGHVVVLLTDGRSNAGGVPVEIAIALARQNGVRVHTVGIGGREARVPVEPAAGDAGRGLRFERHEVDLTALERIAGQTRGRFFAATNPGDLANVYATIDATERVPRPGPQGPQESPHPEPLLSLAGIALLAELGTLRVMRRRLP